MNDIGSPRDDHALILLQAGRARAGLVPRIAALKRYPAADAGAGPAPDKSAYPVRARRAGTERPGAWRGPERRRRSLPVLLDTRAAPTRALDLTV